MGKLMPPPQHNVFSATAEKKKDWTEAGKRQVSEREPLRMSLFLENNADAKDELQASVRQLCQLVP
jgi:hypothetical protein